MSIGIVENLNKSFDFAKNRLFGNWVDWIVLIIVCIIPFINFGFVARVYRGEASLGDWVKMLIDGILMAIIAFVYMIIPCIIAMILIGASFMTIFLDPFGGLATLGAMTIGLIITLIVFIVFGIMLAMAVVRFAKEDSFGAAFQFGELFGIIGKIGWIHYILSWIALFIIFGVIGFILFLLSFIIIGIILAILAIPFFAIWEARYFAQLYESV